MSLMKISNHEGKLSSVGIDNIRIKRAFKKSSFNTLHLVAWRVGWWLTTDMDSG